MHSESHGISGRLTVCKYDSRGNLVETRENHNDITLAGRTLVARLFNHEISDSGDDKIKRISHVWVGSSGEKFDARQDGLVSPIEAPVPIEKIDEVVTANNRVTLRLVAELTEKMCNDQELREAGLFTSDDKPVMYNRVVFAPISKSEQFRLTLVWEITF